LLGDFERPLGNREEELMTVPIFVQTAMDPSIITGIYQGCDQWCMYCPATRQCLAFRCSPEIENGRHDIHRTLADRLYEGVTFMKQLCEAEGRPAKEVDAILNDDPRTRLAAIEIDDPLERIGRRYAHLSDAYLTSRRDYPFEMKRRDSGPTPFEVFAWFYRLIPAKIYRALYGAALAARGDNGLQQDSLVSAKVALIGMDRSIEALATIAVEDDDPRLELLQAQLRRLRREADARFPLARAVVRPGLDCPAAPIPERQPDGLSEPHSGEAASNRILA
jgi:hypothetical protein